MNGDVMQIPASTNFPTGKVSETIAQGATQRLASGAAEAKGAAVTSNSFAPTADLAKLLAAVRELPDVRADVVDDVAGRAAAGDLLTQAAATETAQAAIDDLRLL